LVFEEVLAASSGRMRLMVDLKGSEDGLAEAVADAAKRAAAQSATAFCGGWSHLDRLSTLLPNVPLFYTVGSLRRLAEIQPRLEREEVPAVSIDSRILTGAIVSMFLRSGVREISTWAVETPDIARRVLTWGVSGVTSDSLDLLASIRDGEVGPAAGG
jgi:glycerophosphoryl diester phosphodiesterase